MISPACLGELRNGWTDQWNADRWRDLPARHCAWDSDRGGTPPPQGTGTRPAPSLASSQIYLPDLARQSNPAVRRDVTALETGRVQSALGGGELAIRLERVARPAVWQLPIRGSSVPRLSLASMFAAHEALDT